MRNQARFIKLPEMVFRLISGVEVDSGSFLNLEKTTPKQLNISTTE
jgi:hypothetical protein